MKYKIPSMLVLLVIGIFISFFATANDDQALRKSALSIIGTIPATMPGSANDTEAMVALGEKLYFETNLSANRTQSCNSCHNILNNSHGVDGLSTSTGALGIQGRRNAPTTWNAGFQISQNWDASAKSLAEQAMGPLLDKKEMALSSEKQAVRRLKKAGYKKMFEAVFPTDDKPLNFINITKALAAFQRTLITQDRFDEFMAGDNSALSPLEKEGFLTLRKNGCTSCHSGPLMGGQFVMKLGVVNPYENTQDKGLAEVTGREDHNFLFKVPTLRNVGNTGPYFHDGAVNDLEEVVFLTGWHQLGIELSDRDVAAITAFLQSLDNKKPYKPAAQSN